MRDCSNRHGKISTCRGDKNIPDTLCSVTGDAALAEPNADWLIRNYGPRCTLVSAASALQRLGARSSELVRIIEQATGFNEHVGPPIVAYLGGHSRLDRGIEAAGRQGGIAVKSRTRFAVRWKDLSASLAAGCPVVLNCFRAPSRRWSHSVLAVDCRESPRQLLTLDPNDGLLRWLTWGRPATGWICTATFIQPSISRPESDLHPAIIRHPRQASPHFHRWWCP